VAESVCEKVDFPIFLDCPFASTPSPGCRRGVDPLRRVIRALMLAATKRSSAGVVMLGAALAVTSLIFGIEIDAGPTVLVVLPYQNCNEAHADGRYSIPASDPAYRPDLDLDGDGLACEPSKARRSTR
jgi:Excalibur calcium-binding domain